MVLTLALSINWCIWKLDASNAFLHGFLEDDVYMVRPKGFDVAQYPEYVCKLKRSLCGLKQAPKAWIVRFCGTLIDFGFFRSSFDHSMFIYQFNDSMDDIILVCSSTELNEKIISYLVKIYPMKDLGILN